jgi:hypothetical protein
MTNKVLKMEQVLQELKECQAMASFLSESVFLIMNEHTGFTDKLPVPLGAMIYMDLLTNKIKQLHTRVEGSL